jgi:UDP-N-acetylglucosamine 4-epimerase
MRAFEEAKQRLLRHRYRWLITGCAGFIGSNLLEFLLLHDQEVVGIDNFATGYRSNLDEVALIVGKERYGNFQFIEGDITDYNSCMHACRGVDIVLHQAALGSVPRSIENPIRTNNTNTTGILNLLSVVKELGIRRFVYASSSAVYGDSKELPKVEECTGKLLSPYAVTKMSAELYAGVFWRTYAIETIGLRYFNVFGPRQDPNGAYAAVIPKWISSLLHHEPLYINGDGETSRDFTYIENVVQVNILAGLSENEEAFGEVFNVAVGERHTLNQLYRLIHEGLEELASNFVPQTPTYRAFRQGDIRHSHADISKAKGLLGYEPSHTIAKGLEGSLGWYIQR